MALLHPNPSLLWLSFPEIRSIFLDSAVPIGFLETFHELRGVIRGRRSPQQPGADEQILTASLDREASHQARQKMFPHQRTIPQCW